MRATPCLAFVAVAAGPVHADSFVEVAGGISIPLSDDDWTNLVETSPKLALRAGSYPEKIGVVLSADWMPANTDADGAFGGALDVSAHRFRLLVGPMFHHHVSNLLVAGGRAGLGADIAYAKASSLLGEVSETDVGFGFELAGGVWAKVGSIEIGGEVAIPIGIHDDDNDVIDFNYTSVDLELLFSARFTSH
jgi:hypothetical protein